MWEPRCKLIGLMSLVFAFAFVQDLWLLLPMLLVTITLYKISKLPISFLLQRLRYPSFFLLGIVALLPFFSGRTIIWQWGWLSIYREGCESVVLIASRFFSVLTIALILTGTTPFLTLLQTLRSLGLSPILTDMTLLTYRYLHDIAGNFATMRTAMRLRGGDRRGQPWFHWQLLPQFAILTGTLLIRSYEQSERVYQAMRLRGYGLPKQSGSPEPAHGRGSFIALGVSLVVAAGFVLVGHGGWGR
jgi:cobalt/nickel transport system permease protein